MPVHSLTRPELQQLIARLAKAVEGGSRGSPAPRPADGERISQAAGQKGLSASGAGLDDFARLIDHTLLRPEATRNEVKRLCQEALLHGFGAVYVAPAWVPAAAAQLYGSPVNVGTVVGFPFGGTLPSAKRAEAEAAMRVGARELDMVLNVGALRSGDMELAESDIRGVAEISHASGCILKVILENAYLSEGQKVTACRIAQQAGADYVKTSTGFGPSGASEADVRLMRETVGPRIGVKAAGGIRTLGDALRMLAAGADRLGTSASVAIWAEASRCGN